MSSNLLLEVAGVNTRCRKSSKPTQTVTPQSREKNLQFKQELSEAALAAHYRAPQMVWRVRGRERQAYSFGYDHLSRLSSASYYDVNTSNTATASSRFNESPSYDIRGNITSLCKPTTKAPFQSLQY